MSGPRICLILFTMLLILPGQGYRLCAYPRGTGHINQPCCPATSTRNITQTIILCIQQRANSSSCKKDAFVIKVKSGHIRCVDPAAEWLDRKLEKDNICCHSY